MNNFFLALGGGNEIGASCYLLALGNTRILIDAGMRIGAQRVFPDLTPLYHAIDHPQSLSAFFLTHAHLDHCGAITRIYHEAPHVPKYATAPTLELAEVMLNDALRVAETQSGEDWHITDTRRALLEDAVHSFNLIDYGEEVKVGHEGCTVKALRAGHILGASAYLIEADGLRVLHTGDFCLHNQRTVPGAAFVDGVGNVDIMIIETTYAYQPEYRDETVQEQQHRLAMQIGEVVQNGGRVLVPAFALGRAQEVATLLSDYFEQDILRPFPVLLDGLVQPISDCYDKFRELLLGRPASRPGHAVYSEWVHPVSKGYYPTKSSVSSLAPGCIIASSGMLLDKTRSSRYAETILTCERDAVFFSGYLDDESPGSRLLRLSQGAQSCVINGVPIRIAARVDRYHLSAHANSASLRHVIRTLKPKRVILIHGDRTYNGDPSFVQFCLDLERSGVHFDQSANGVPVFF